MNEGENNLSNNAQSRQLVTNEGVRQSHSLPTDIINAPIQQEQASRNDRGVEKQEITKTA